MPELPAISGREPVRAFEKDGRRIVRRARRKHIIMKKKGVVTTLSVAEHKVLDRGLLRSLIRDAYISIQKFSELLKR